jgi:hypothetical protein
MTIEQRIEGRKDLEFLIKAMIEDHPNDQDYKLGIANACQCFIDSHLKTQTLLTMNEEQAAAFERERITFGKHAGLTYSEAPEDYLEWLADQAIRLQSYLRWKARRR